MNSSPSSPSTAWNDNTGPAEQQYLDLVKRVIATGYQRPDRTGTGTRALHGQTLRFDLARGTVPLLTTKKIPWSAIVHELLWFLSGSTNIQPLLKNNVTIWSEWPHARYQAATTQDPSLPSLTLKEFERHVRDNDAFADRWGSIGKGYGHQWRRWEGPDGRVYDQITDVIERIKKDPNSRRLLFHGWNVADLEDMALPPCHLLYQFFVAQGRLSLTMYQRSCDVGLGLPFNIASCALLVHLVAQQCNLDPGELFWVGHDVHVYNNHIDPLQEQCARTPKPFPTITLTQPGPASLFDVQASDIHLHNYNPHPPIKMIVAV